MRISVRLSGTALLLAVICPAAWGHYYWTYFAGRTGPFQPVPARFDLNALPNKTVSYFISSQQPSKLVDGDSFDSLVSEIRLAAEAWNGVSTSDLRLRFGGIAPIGMVQATPGIDVVFDDDNMPPGVLAQTTPSFPSDVGDLTKGAGFVPLLR